MTKDKLIGAFLKIKNAENILLVTHNRPDGDALSSVGVLTEILIGMGKEFVSPKDEFGRWPRGEIGKRRGKFSSFCLDQPPDQFYFLPHMEKICFHRDRLNFTAYDLIVALDCGQMSRTNLTEEIKHKNSRQFIIEFDHHPKIDNYADIEIRDSTASSTAEVLYHFLRVNKIKINKNIANCILTGILTDTGNFLFPSTTDVTVKIASEMLLYGARFPTILENTWRNKSLSAMKIWGRAINNLQVNKKYNFAYSVLSYDVLSAGDVTEEELEGIAGFLSNLYGVNGLMLLREEKRGRIKGSLRTARSDIDISFLAQMLGGGGHAKASGFNVDGYLQQISGRWLVT